MKSRDGYALTFITTVIMLLLLRPFTSILSWRLPSLVAKGLSPALLLLASGSLAIFLRKSPWGFGTLILVCVVSGTLAFLLAWLVPSW
ncbi:MAG TPA: hypothetical protein VJS64_17845 [Pyrinomonadaceae bacterium]|nr:hypothetical protein [Pyrinomonadaceae bacterium]